MASATDFIRDLLSQAQAEQAGAPDLSEYADLIDSPWHWVGPAWTLPSADSTGTGGTGRVVGFGDEFTVTAAMMENSLDRNGHSFLAQILRNESEQIRVFGAVCARPGPWPEGVIPFEPGSVRYVEAAHAERERAAKISDPDRRNAAMRGVRQKYGDSAYFSGASQQHSTDYLGGPTGRDLGIGSRE